MTVPVPYQVVSRRQETADTATLTLAPAGPPLPHFRPGQYAMAYAFGCGEIPLSVSGIDPADRGGGGQLLLHTVRAVGAVSGALYRAGPGTAVGVRGPYGTWWDLDSAEGGDVLVVAGGIGLAPLRPLVADLLARPGSYRHRNVLVGARSPGDLVYRSELPAWSGIGGMTVGVTVDRADSGWAGEVGVVTTLLGRARFHPPETTAFVCGPEAMIRATARELVHRGVAGSRIQVSLERNMRCGTGHCGHCQLGPLLLCRDGPVVGWDRAEPLLAVREL